MNFSVACLHQLLLKTKHQLGGNYKKINECQAYILLAYGEHGVSECQIVKTRTQKDKWERSNTQCVYLIYIAKWAH